MGTNSPYGEQTKNIETKKGFEHDFFLGVCGNRRNYCSLGCWGINFGDWYCNVYSKMCNSY